MSWASTKIMEGNFMKHWMTWKEVARSALVIGLLASGAWACGDDDDGDEPTAGTGASGTGASGTGASGTSGGGSGGSGGGGSGGSGGTGGTPAPMTIMCGTATCMGGMLQGTPTPPCCDMDSGNVCGLVIDAMTMACEGVMQPGTDDPSCPSEMSIIMTNLAGCCKPDNKCGVRSGSLMGCIERTDYPTQFLAQVNMMAPPPLSAVDCGGDTDGGI
jgi:hypothetical protein